MNVMCLNCRGIRGNKFSKLMNDLVQEYHLSLCFLLEMHASFVKAEAIVRRFGFDSHHIEGSNGQLGGLWCLWKSRF